MRSILFFDLPSVTLKDKTHYRHFVKTIKKLGFYSIQESVYVKLSIDRQQMESIIDKVRDKVPPNGNIIVLNITEKQFSQIQILLGESKTKVISSTDRIIVL